MKKKSINVALHNSPKLLIHTIFQLGMPRTHPPPFHQIKNPIKKKIPNLFLSRTSKTNSNWNNNNQNNHKQKQNPKTQTFSTIPLQILCCFQILGPIYNILRSIHNVMFNIIHFLPLCFNHDCHIQKHLV